MRFRFALLAWFACVGVGRADPGDLTPERPRIPDGLFQLSAFGGVGDGRTSNTAALKAAVAAVEKARGGTLEVAPGRYLTGPFSLCDRIRLRLDQGATLVFSSDPHDYVRDGRHLSPQLAIARRHDVEITGGGTIDGQGGAWWPAARAMRDPVTGRQLNGTTTARPAMVVFLYCQRIRVQGITLTNSPALNLGINGGRDSTIEGITILNPPDSPNTDGIDPKGAQRVLIARCRIDTGDDCVAAGGGRGEQDERDILITDCTFLRGHGCSIGSGTAGGVKNFTVRRCRFDGTDTAIRLKSGRDRGGLVENVTYENLSVRNVGHVISISSQYQGTTTDTAQLEGAKGQPLTPLTPEWRDITLRNIVAQGTVIDAGTIAGLPEMPIENLVLDNVGISAPRGLGIGYTRGLTLNAVAIHVRQGAPLTVAPTVTDVRRSAQ